MSKTKQLTRSYYMVRLSGGQWSPKAKHLTLGEALDEAARLSKESGKPATVISTFIRVEYLNGQYLFEEVLPSDFRPQSGDTDG